MNMKKNDDGIKLP